MATRLRDRLEAAPSCPHGRHPLLVTLAVLMKSTVEPLEGNKVKLSVDPRRGRVRTGGRRRLPPHRQGGPHSRASVPARSRAACSKPGWASDRPGPTPCSTPSPSTTRRPCSEHEVDVIAAPEIDITAGQDAGDVVFDAVVEVRPTGRTWPATTSCGSPSTPPSRPTRTSPSASTSSATRTAELVSRRPRRPRRRPRHHRHRRRPGRRAAVGPDRRGLPVRGRQRHGRSRAGRAAPGRQGRRHPRASPPTTPTPTRVRSTSASWSRRSRRRSSPRPTTPLPPRRRSSRPSTSCAPTSPSGSR